MINNECVDFFLKEFELLLFLVFNFGKSYDWNKILNFVWGYDFDGYEYIVNLYINCLCGKIEFNL